MVQELAKNKLLVHLPVRVLNLGDHTNQEAHDAPWFGARGSNTGPGLMTPESAPPAVHRWASAFSITAKFVSFNSQGREISEKSRGVIAAILLTIVLLRENSSFHFYFNLV